MSRSLRLYLPIAILIVLALSAAAYFSWIGDYLGASLLGPDIGSTYVPLVRHTGTFHCYDDGSNFCEDRFTPGFQKEFTLGFVATTTPRIPHVALYSCANQNQSSDSGYLVSTNQDDCTSKNLRPYRLGFLFTGSGDQPPAIEAPTKIYRCSRGEDILLTDDSQDCQLGEYDGAQVLGYTASAGYLPGQRLAQVCAVAKARCSSDTQTDPGLCQAFAGTCEGVSAHTAVLGSAQQQATLDEVLDSSGQVPPLEAQSLLNRAVSLVGSTIENVQDQVLDVVRGDTSTGVVTHEDVAVLAGISSNATSVVQTASGPAELYFNDPRAAAACPAGYQDAGAKRVCASATSSENNFPSCAQNEYDITAKRVCRQVANYTSRPGSGTVAYYKFDEAGGSSSRDQFSTSNIGSGAVGTATGGIRQAQVNAAWTADVPPTKFSNASALDFSVPPPIPRVPFLTLPGSGWAGDNDGTFSYAYWTKPAQTITDAYLVPAKVKGPYPISSTDQQSGGYGPNVGGVNSPEVVLHVRTGTNGVSVIETPYDKYSSQALVVAAAPVAISGWTHIAVVSSPAETQLYINGKLEDSSRANPIRKKIQVGGLPAGGQLDEVRFYDHALSADEAARLGAGEDVAFSRPLPQTNPLAGNTDPKCVTALTLGGSVRGKLESADTLCANGLYQGTSGARSVIDRYTFTGNKGDAVQIMAKDPSASRDYRKLASLQLYAPDNAFEWQGKQCPIPIAEGQYATCVPTTANNWYTANQYQYPCSQWKHCVSTGTTSSCSVPASSCDLIVKGWDTNFEKGLVLPASGTYTLLVHGAIGLEYDLAVQAAGGLSTAPATVATPRLVAVAAGSAAEEKCRCEYFGSRWEGCPNNTQCQNNGKSYGTCTFVAGKSSNTQDYSIFSSGNACLAGGLPPAPTPVPVGGSVAVPQSTPVPGSNPSTGGTAVPKEIKFCGKPAVPLQDNRDQKGDLSKNSCSVTGVGSGHGYVFSGQAGEVVGITSHNPASSGPNSPRPSQVVSDQDGKKVTSFDVQYLPFADGYMMLKYRLPTTGSYSVFVTGGVFASPFNDAYVLRLRRLISPPAPTTSVSGQAPIATPASKGLAGDALKTLWDSWVKDACPADAAPQDCWNSYVSNFGLNGPVSWYQKECSVRALSIDNKSYRGAFGTDDCKPDNTKQDYVDIYSLQGVKRGDKIRVTVDAANSTTLPYLLKKPSAAPASGFFGFISYGPGPQPIINFTATDDGTYLLRVNGNTDQARDYAIRAERY